MLDLLALNLTLHLNLPHLGQNSRSPHRSRSLLALQTELWAVRADKEDAQISGDTVQASVPTAMVPTEQAPSPTLMGPNWENLPPASTTPSHSVQSGVTDLGGEGSCFRCLLCPWHGPREPASPGSPLTAGLRLTWPSEGTVPIQKVGTCALPPEKNIPWKIPSKH